MTSARGALCVVSLTCLALPAWSMDDSATDYWVRLMPDVWFAQLRGSIAYQGSNGVPPSSLTMNDLDLGQRKAAPNIEAGVNFPFLFTIDAGYSSFSNSGSANVDQSFVFGNTIYQANTTVDTKVALRDAWGEIGIRPIDRSVFGFGVGIAVHAVHGSVEITDAQAGTDESFSKTVPLPALSVRAHLTPIRGLTFEARVHIFDAGYDGQHAKYTDAEAQVSYRPRVLPFIGILGGYHYTLYDLHVKDTNDNEEASIDVTLAGPYVGLIAQF